MERGRKDKRKQLVHLMVDLKKLFGSTLISTQEKFQTTTSTQSMFMNDEKAATKLPRTRILRICGYDRIKNKEKEKENQEETGDGDNF